jgi:ribonuclease P protein subunit POP4
MRNEKNILRHELIGLSVEVAESKIKTYENIKGKIIDETEKTFMIKTNDKRKRVLKKNTTFIVSLPKKRLKIKGDLLIGRPEDRIKKKIKKW